MSLIITFLPRRFHNCQVYRKNHKKAIPVEVRGAASCFDIQVWN